MVIINKGTNTHVHTSCTSKYMHINRHINKSLIWDLILVILDHVIGSTPVMDKKDIE